MAEGTYSSMIYDATALIPGQSMLGSAASYAYSSASYAAGYDTVVEPVIAHITEEELDFVDRVGAILTPF